MGATDRTLACPECGTAYIQGVKFCAECGIALSNAPGEFRDLGAVVGNYRLLEVLGEGGMGRVYVAEHVKLGRRVAVKKLHSEMASNPTAVARFFAEARAVNRISHDNIVEITDFLEQPGGDNYIVMELLKGEDLAHRLRRKRTLPLPRAFDIAAQTASALAAVHAAGMIHRDLKPDNIYLIERAGNPDFVKVLDFGVAKLTDNGASGVPTHVTAAGQILGTPEYMSPEQAGGMAVDYRTDIYALGVILYEMVTGVLPFQAKSFGELLIQHMTSPVELPGFVPGLPQVIQTARDQLLLQLLAKKPSDRPKSMTEVETRLRTLIDALEPPRRPQRGSSERAASVNELVEVLAKTSGGAAPATPTTAVGAVAKLALIKRPTAPQAAVEMPTPRQISRIEVPTPTNLGRYHPDLLARASTDVQAAAVTGDIARPASDGEVETQSARQRIARLQVTGSRPGIVVPEARGTGSESTLPPRRPTSMSALVDSVDVYDDELEIPSEVRPIPAAVFRRASRATLPEARLESLGSGPASSNDGCNEDPIDAGHPVDAPLEGRAEDAAGDGLAPRDAAVAAASASQVLRARLEPAGESRSPVVPPALGEPGAAPPARSVEPGLATCTPAAAARVAPPPDEPAPRRRARWLGALGAVIAGGVLVYQMRQPAAPSEATRGAPSTGPRAAVVPALTRSAPAAPAEVKLKFVSAPPGATVRRGDTGETLGTTPFAASFPRSERSVRFEFALPGFAPAAQEVALSADDAIAAALVPIAPPSTAAAAPEPPRRPAPVRRAPPAPAPAPVDRNGTLDVFKPSSDR